MAEEMVHEAKVPPLVVEEVVVVHETNVLPLGEAGLAK